MIQYIPIVAETSKNKSCGGEEFIAFDKRTTLLGDPIY